MTRIYEASGGIPRRINTISNLCLLVGQGAGITQIDADIVNAGIQQQKQGTARSSFSLAQIPKRAVGEEEAQEPQPPSRPQEEETTEGKREEESSRAQTFRQEEDPLPSQRAEEPQKILTPDARRIFSGIYDNLLASAGAAQPRIVLVCSASNGEGASTVAAGLAIAAAEKRAGQVELVVTEYGIWPADSTDARDFSNLARALYDADLLMTLLQHGAELGVTLATAWNLHGDIETAAIGYDWDTGTRRLRPNYHAFQLLRSSLKPKQLSTTVRSPSFRTSRVGNVARRSGIPFLNAVASLDVNNGKLNLLVLNRSLTDAISTTIRLNGFLPASTAQVRTLKGPSVRAHNEDVSTTVGIVISNLAQASSSFAYTFPPYSLTSIEFSP